MAFTRKGYGQVEPNHLSAQYTGQIYAQLPALTATVTTGTSAETVYMPIDQLENGQFLKYDYAAGCADVAGAGEWLLVYNEEKLYDERYQNHKDFVVKATDMSDGKIYPRLLKTNIGDIFTTNTFRTSAAKTVGSNTEEIEMPTLALGDYVKINDAGWLEGNGTTKPDSGIVFQVAMVYTLPDMQPAVKLQRIQ